jgi:hypothetical protein
MHPQTPPRNGAAPRCRCIVLPCLSCSSAMVKLADKLKLIARPTITHCIFCGRAGPLTDEHVFPRWSHQFLPTTRTNKYESVRGIRGPGGDQFHVVRRPGDIRDWKIPCACTPNCNNGWMRRDIENRARSIMIPLIRGEGMRITPAEQSIIAAWAALKAMVAEWNVKGHVTTHHMHRKRMMWRTLPPERGWGIWIGRFVSDPAKPIGDRYLTSWESHPFLLLPDKLALGRPNKKPPTSTVTRPRKSSANSLFKRSVRRCPTSSRDGDLRCRTGGHFFEFGLPAIQASCGQRRR